MPTEQEIRDAFGPRLRELREAAGMTQQQLADALGVGQVFIWRWETGNRYPTWHNVCLLADAIGVNVEAFRQPPAEREAPKRGRPAKAKAAEPPGEKKKRGRPRKDQL